MARAAVVTGGTRGIGRGISTAGVETGLKAPVGRLDDRLVLPLNPIE